MRRSKTTPRRAWVPTIDGLEARVALAIAGASLGQRPDDVNDLANLDRPNGGQGATHVGSDGLHDLHLRLTGLRSGAGKRVAVVDVTDPSDGVRQQYQERSFASAYPGVDTRLPTPAFGLRDAADGTRTADLYLQWPKVATNATLDIVVTYEDRTTDSVSIAGVAVDPALSTTKITATSLGQDNRDFVGRSNVAGSDRLQDGHIALSGLPDRIITQVDVDVAGGGYFQFVLPGLPPAQVPRVGPTQPDPSRWRAAFGHEGRSSTADLYLQDHRARSAADPSMQVYDIYVTYADESHSHVRLTGVVNDPTLAVRSAPVPVGTAAGVSLGQDGSDTANKGNRVGRDGLKDLHLRLSNLKTQGIARVDVRDITTGVPVTPTFQYREGWAADVGVPFDPSLTTPTLGRAGGNPAQLADPTRYATTADLYLQAESPRALRVTVTYADKSAETFDVGNVVNIPGLRMASGDYDGDGKADIVGYNRLTGAWDIKYNGAGLANFGYGLPGKDIPVPGDYNGDGRTEAAVFRGESANWYAGNTARQFGVPGLDIPVPAAYGESDRTDLAVYRPSNATWYIRHQGTGRADQAIPFGWINRDVPTPADFDGNGFDQVAVYRPLDVATRAEGGGTFFILDPRTGAVWTAPLFNARAGDVPVPADYNGDGLAEPALYRPSTGQYFIYSGPNDFKTRTFGVSPGDVPIPGDTNGDGHVEPAVFRPETKTWAYYDDKMDVILSAPPDTLRWASTTDTVAVAGPYSHRRGALFAQPRPAGLSASGSAPAGSPATSRTTTTASTPGPGSLSAARRRTAIRPQAPAQGRTTLRLVGSASIG